MNALWENNLVPAVPHNPNPALNTMDPLSRSATASSAFLYTFDPPLLIFGAGSRLALVFAFCSSLVEVVCSCREIWNRGVGCARAVLRMVLRVELARHTGDIRLVAIFTERNTEFKVPEQL